MAVAFDAVGPGSSGTGTSTPGTALSWTHTASASGVAVVVGVACGHNPAADGTFTVTCDGNAMTALAAVNNNNQTGSSSAGLTQLFGIANRSSGAHTINVSVSGGGNVNYSLVAGSVSYSGASTSGPFGSANTAFGSGSAPAVTLSGTTSGNMVAGVASIGSGTLSNPATSRWLNNFSTVNAAGEAGQSDKVGGGSVTFTWSDGGSDWWGAAAVEILAGSTTDNGTVTASATVAASFGGGRIQFRSLSTAVTSHAVFAGTKTGLAHLNPAATAHAVFTRTRTTFGQFPLAAAAHAVFAGTKTALGHFNAAATATARFTALQPPRPPKNLGALLSQVNYAGSAPAATLFGTVSSTSLSGTLTPAVFAGTVTVNPPEDTSRTDELGVLLNQAAYGGTTAVNTLSGTSVNTNVLDVTFSQLNSGGTVTSPLYSGTNIASVTAGTAVISSSPLSVSMSQLNSGGSIVTTTFDGSVTGWTMQNVNLSLAEFNDIALSATITNNGSALDLTGSWVRIVLKTAAGIADTDPSTVAITATVTNSTAGQCSVVIPHSDLQSQDLEFYRIDVMDGSGNVNTAAYGAITYTAL